MPSHSGVRVGPLGDGRVRVRLVLRGQRSDFPSDEESALFERVRRLAEPALAAYREGIVVAQARGDKQAAKEMTVFAKRLEKQFGA